MEHLKIASFRLRPMAPIIITKAIVGNVHLSVGRPIVPAHTFRGALLSLMVQEGIMDQVRARRLTNTTFYPLYPEGYVLQGPFGRKTESGPKFLKMEIMRKILVLNPSDMEEVAELLADINNYEKPSNPIEMKTISVTNVAIDKRYGKAKIEEEGGRLFSYEAWLPIRKDTGEKVDFITIIVGEEDFLSWLESLGRRFHVFIGRGRSRGFGLLEAKWREIELDLTEHIEKSTIGENKMASFLVGFGMSIDRRGWISPLPDCAIENRAYGGFESFRRWSLSSKGKQLLLKVSVPGTLLLTEIFDSTNVLRGVSRLSHMGLNLAWPLSAMYQVTDIMKGVVK